VNLPGARSAAPLVTVLGASGFLGSAVVAELARRPIRLRAVSRRPPAVPTGARAAVETRTADVTVRTELRSALAGSDAVVDLLLPSDGWRGGRGGEGERVIVGVVRELLDHFAAAGSRPAVVLAGSTSQVGVPARLPVDGTGTDRPASDYDRHKLAAERLLTAAARENVVRGTTLRLSTVYGCGPPGGAPDRGVLAAMTRRALEGRPLTVWQAGPILRDFLHVTDAAAAFACAVDRAGDLSPGHWVVGSGEAASLHEVFQAIARTVAELTGDPPVAVRSVPPPPEAAPTDLASMVVDASAFRSVTGWRPRVPRPAGLSRLAAELVSGGKSATGKWLPGNASD
jgi:nucleoside-diphosphate-sugar epimerase